MSSAAYHKNLYDARVAARQCVRCGRDLPTGQRKKWCSQCLARKATENRSLRLRSKSLDYEAAKAAGKCPTCGYPWTGSQFVTCDECRERSRVRCKQWRERTATDAPRKSTANESPKWNALDESMAFMCPHCGLRGEHECLKANAWDRPGAGYTLPDRNGIGELTTVRVRNQKARNQP